MNDIVNWQKHAICSPSRAGRKSKDQLPDVICTQEYAVKIEEEYSINTTVELKGKLAVFCIYVTQCELYSQESSYEQDDTSFASS